MSKQENERHRQALQALADAKAVRAWESKRSEMARPIPVAAATRRAL
jgi:hypothetical protein